MAVLLEMARIVRRFLFLKLLYTLAEHFQHSLATAVRERCAARVSIVGKPSIEHIHSMHLSI